MIYLNKAYCGAMGFEKDTLHPGCTFESLYDN